MRTHLRLHKDLIAELDEFFPLRNTPPNDTMERIRYVSGQRSVVEFLLDRLKNQEAALTVLGDR